MKKKRFYLYGIGLLSAVLWAGCSDDTVVVDVPEPPLAEGSMDLTNGYQVVMVDVSRLEDFRLKLGTRRELLMTIHDSSFPLELREEVVDSVKYLVGQLKEGTKTDAPEFAIPKSYKVSLALKDEAEVTKDIELVLRRSATVGTSDDVSYAQSIGRGTKLWADMGNTTERILDFGVIAGELANNQSSIQSGIQFEIGGTRYEETMEKLSESLGISGSIGIKKKYALSGGVTYSKESMTNTSQNYEYYLGYYGKNMAEVRVNPDWLVSVAGADRANVHVLLDETTNDVLNNPGSDAYQVYSNDTIAANGQKSLFDLLDHYGTHVITKASFGGNFIYMYARQENMYESSISEDASSNITLKYSAGGAAQTWLQEYQKIHHSPYISADKSRSEYDYDYQEATKALTVIKSNGGNASLDVTEWEQAITADNKSTWIPISYSTLDEPDGQLIPIYEFVKDPERRAALEAAFEPYFAKNVTERRLHRPILADFMMRNGANGHKDGDPEPFVDEDPFGHKLLYFPMMANQNAPADKGYAFETSQSTYVSVNDDVDQYWYYAISYEDEHPGIVDIKIKEKKPDGYTQRGDNADCDGSALGIIVNKEVYVKYASSSEPKENLITGVGIYGRDDDGKIFASSGGTEWKQPFDYADNIEYFNSYWSDEWRVNPDCEVWFEGASNHHPLKVCYTRKPLPDNFCFGLGPNDEPVSTSQITHPKKWGE